MSRSSYKEVQNYKDLKLGVHIIPGLATFKDIDNAIENGVNTFELLVIVLKQTPPKHI